MTERRGGSGWGRGGSTGRVTARVGIVVAAAIAVTGCRGSAAGPSPAASGSAAGAAVSPALAGPTLAGPTLSGAPAPPAAGAASAVASAAAGPIGGRVPAEWVGIWTAGMTVYTNAVPGADTAGPIAGRDIHLTLSAEGRLAYRITEHATENFQPVGPGKSCAATARLEPRGEAWVVVEETSSCIRAWPLPHEHAVSLRIVSPCILKVRATPNLSGGIEDMAFTQPDCVAALRGARTTATATAPVAAPSPPRSASISSASPPPVTKPRSLPAGVDF